MELILLVPMLIIVFVGAVMIFVAATALFPVALATILIFYFRNSATDRAKDRHRLADAGRHLGTWFKSLFHHHPAPH